ncbi:hypothetical protein D3C85_1823720 [compost metagenome]
MFFQVLNRFGSYVWISELRETRRTEESAATVDHIGHAITIQRLHAILVQPEVTVLNAINF